MNVKNINDLSNLIEFKFVIAAVFMIIIIASIIAVISLVVISFKKRKEAIAVKLPDINASGEIASEPVFSEPENLVVELIQEQDEEDVIKNSKIVNNDDQFLTALSYETKRCFPEGKSGSVPLPEVEQVDYDQLVEHEKNKRMDRIKELANKDKEEEFNSRETE